MNETTKARTIRQRNGDFDRYLRGEGIDIGCGNDPLIIDSGRVRHWDQMNGDAQNLPGIPMECFDFVYSSHCLEHLRSVPEALRTWGNACKVGGYLYVVVPEWTFYEHRQWPSLHNPDHKASFSILDCEIPESHPHFTLASLIAIGMDLGLKLQESRLELEGFDFSLHRVTPPFVDQTMSAAQAQMLFVFQKCTATT